MFFKGFLKSKRVYLDYAASTPPGAVLQKKLQLPHAALIANPSGLHQEAVLAKRYREAARARVAEVLGAQKNEIIFTSGATESNNLALQGTVRSWIAQGVAPEKIFLMVSELEHSAVRRVAEELKNMYNIGVVCLPAINGVVSPKEIQIPEGAAAILISVLFTQNEFGTIQPIKEIAKRIRFFRKQYPEVQIVFHSDATQAPRYYELRVQTLGVDLLTIGAT